jgi:hypothetical protein
MFGFDSEVEFTKDLKNYANGEGIFFNKINENLTRKGTRFCII